jgi:hypothetical protein
MEGDFQNGGPIVTRFSNCWQNALVPDMNVGGAHFTKGFGKHKSRSSKRSIQSRNSTINRTEISCLTFNLQLKVDLSQCKLEMQKGMTSDQGFWQKIFLGLRPVEIGGHRRQWSWVNSKPYCEFQKKKKKKICLKGTAMYPQFFLRVRISYPLAETLVTVTCEMLGIPSARRPVWCKVAMSHMTLTGCWVKCSFSMFFIYHHSLEWPYRQKTTDITDVQQMNRNHTNHPVDRCNLT